MSKETIKAKPVKNNSKNGSKTSFFQEVKFLGLSLVSNDTCVEARHKPWWSALTIMLVSSLLALLPLSLSQFNKNGGDFLNSPDYGYENALVDFGDKVQATGLHMQITEGKLAIVDTEWNAAFPSGYYLHSYEKEVTVNNPATSETSDSTSDSSTSSAPVGVTTETVTVKDFALYWVSPTLLSANQMTFSDYIKSASALGGTDPAGNTTYSINCLFLSEVGYVAYKLPSGTGTPVNSISGIWDGKLANFDLSLLTKQDINGTPYAADKATNPTEWGKETLAGWKSMMQAAYDSTRVSVGWEWTGIFGAIFVGLALFLGLSVWLMTRGKNNPFNIYTFWESQKIAWWASLTPGVLAMILAFIFSSTAFTMMFYIFLYGMRIMWMSMRSLRPQYNTQN